jgi:undecaprenyl-diphosphatase
VDAILEFLQNIDAELFLFFNQTLSFYALDQIMPILTDLHKYQLFSFGFMPILLMVYILNQKKQAAKVLIGVVLCIAIADGLNYRVFKQLAERPRPEKSLEQITLRTKSHSGHSFPSNHAANMFAVMTFLSGVAPHFRFFFYLMAGLIAYSRVYVGVHYPFDVIAGAIVGFIIGKLLFMLFKRWLVKNSFFPDFNFRKIK